MDARAPFAIEQKGVAPSPWNPILCLPQLSRVGAQQAAAMEAWPMVLRSSAIVRASAASPRPPTISPFALSFSLPFFPSLTMATSRERRPWRPGGGCASPQTPSPARVHPWRRARQRLPTRLVGRPRGRQRHASAGRGPFSPSLPPLLRRAGLGNPLLSAVLQRFMNAAH
jgi:hypothetical protein